MKVRILFLIAFALAVAATMTQHAGATVTMYQPHGPASIAQAEVHAMGHDGKFPHPILVHDATVCLVTAPSYCADTVPNTYAGLSPIIDTSNTRGGRDAWTPELVGTVSCGGSGGWWPYSVDALDGEYCGDNVWQFVMEVIPPLPNICLGYNGGTDNAPVVMQNCGGETYMVGSGGFLHGVRASDQYCPNPCYADMVVNLPYGVTNGYILRYTANSGYRWTW